MNPASLPAGMNGFHHGNIASSSANPYPDFSHVNPPMYTSSHLPAQPQRQHQHHPSQPQSQQTHAINQNQWNPPMQQNSLSHVPIPSAPQNQLFNQPGWSNVNQMHPQQFPNGIPAMGGFNIPFIQQQMIQDAFALSAPVEQADEKILLQALVESRSRRATYKDALNALHGKNGHSASLWKDYYLDHKDRLDETISVYLNPPKVALQAIKKPSPSAYKTEPSPAAPSRGSAKRQTPSDHRPLQPATGGRSTINSLTAPAPVFGDRLPPPNADIQIPEPPSRSPTPPTIVIPHRGRGNKYTPEDREFFLKFIAWRLKGDPTLTRNDLCAMLAEKAPHHTSQSWASYWSNRHDVPDKILAAAKGDEHDSNEFESEEEEKITVRRRPIYRESSSEDEEEDEEDDTADAEGESDGDDDAPIKVWPESEMGPRGGPFTDADLYVTAKYMISFPSFDEASGKERWQPYSERFPQRSAKSWAEYYRRNEASLQRLARRMKRQGHHVSGGSSIQAQRARPSWASTDTSDSHRAKRKYSVDPDADGEDDNERPPSRNKRGRGGDA
ncbi:hypothetical protein D9615_001395 [Tricholomella constricta]|uniref:Uncharacterized protein n=1 Tax=Tricholomella constricta TaxID=117010 RepID=A0A8H5M8C1_9AGAR|nr:hypothetical protein D9615_001395 [Tricholomella constricta]